MKEKTEIEKESFEDLPTAEELYLDIDKDSVGVFDKMSQMEIFIEKNPLFYDENGLFWIWDKLEFKYKRTNEINILNGIQKAMNLEIINSKKRTEIINALKQVGRKHIPEKPLDSWIQFQDKIHNLENGEIMKATPKYFTTNSLPFKLGKSEDTPEIDKLFSSWVGEEHQQELYEILAFSIVPNYFIHRMFCLIGSGANGKSTYLRILEKFIGQENLTSSSLNLLMKERFEGSKLLNKLVCLIGETNFNLISNTDYLKKLTGEDLVRCEFKGKDIFDFRNYAKLIMATNSLPPTADKTEGFYRRWKIIKFPNKFQKEKDVLSKIPKEEYNNLALKCLNIAKRLWKNRIFTNDGDFKERKKRYEDESNPLNKFVVENYVKDMNGEVLFSDFFESLNLYLEERGQRLLSSPAVSKQLKNEGVDIKHLTKEGINARFILGLNDRNDTNDTTSISNLHVKMSKKLSHSSHLSHSQRDLLDKKPKVVKIGDKKPDNSQLNKQEDKHGNTK